MKLTIYGTAAAEGWPALFCDCENCEAARKEGGHSVRTRSQSLVNDDLLIDFPSDAYLHVLNYGLDLRPVRDLIVTHFHEDHFVADDLFYRRPPFGHLKDLKPLHIRGNEAVVAEFSRWEKEHWGESQSEYVDIALAREFEPFDAVGGRYTIHPMRADHDKKQKPLFYIIKDNLENKTLLYAHDTGYFPDDDWTYIKDNGFSFDLVTLDCTHQTDPQRTNHMGLPTCAEVRDRLLDMGALKAGTPCLVNHFSHNGKCATHAQLALEAERRGFICAYDGISVEV